MSCKTAKSRDWTKRASDNPGHEPIRWRQWAEQTITVLEGANPSGYSRRAEAMLLAIADYLDDQYDGGYDGIALLPREDFVLTFEW
jgi:hypothetical protein